MPKQNNLEDGCWERLTNIEFDESLSFHEQFGMEKKWFTASKKDQEKHWKKLTNETNIRIQTRKGNLLKSLASVFCKSVTGLKTDVKEIALRILKSKHYDVVSFLFIEGRFFSAERQKKNAETKIIFCKIKLWSCSRAKLVIKKLLVSTLHNWHLRCRIFENGRGVTRILLRKGRGYKLRWTSQIGAVFFSVNPPGGVGAQPP